MTARYVLTTQAQQDFAEIADHIAESSGLAPAEQVLGELRRGFQLLAEHPEVGHVRADLPDDPEVRFWSVYSYLIVFVPAARPLAVVSILHGARDPQNIAKHIQDARASEG
jgi:plasmid stabilization system protein ParE